MCAVDFRQALANSQTLHVSTRIIPASVGAALALEKPCEPITQPCTMYASPDNPMIYPIGLGRPAVDLTTVPYKSKDAPSLPAHPDRPGLASRTGNNATSPATIIIIPTN